jgi:hypothetical protein
MKKDGEWAGHLELQAISKAFHINIKVYQYNSPILQFFYHEKAETVHLSYHNGEHYNSVVVQSDKIKKLHNEIEVSKISKNEKIIMESTGCDDIELVRSALNENWNDVDATIEYMIAVQNQFNNTEEEIEVEQEITQKERKIMNKTGCNDIKAVRKVYEEMGFDVEATIDYLSVNLIEQQNEKKEKVKIKPTTEFKESNISKK